VSPACLTGRSALTGHKIVQCQNTIMGGGGDVGEVDKRLKQFHRNLFSLSPFHR
jgi:hypothetical protein